MGRARRTRVGSGGLRSASSGGVGRDGPPLRRDRFELATDDAQLVADLAAQEDQGDDGDDGDKSKDKSVFSETLTVVVSTEPVEQATRRVSAVMSVHLLSHEDRVCIALADRVSVESTLGRIG